MADTPRQRRIRAAFNSLRPYERFYRSVGIMLGLCMLGVAALGFMVGFTGWQFLHWFTELGLSIGLYYTGRLTGELDGWRKGWDIAATTILDEKERFEREKLNGRR